ncbi:hypothetical protein NMY22_g11684 [Coprinellus aureogranulatus]|nr:hypothetical protein NMY22_g11684 [Coprinellus aureogranulatus]
MTDHKAIGFTTAASSFSMVLTTFLTLLQFITSLAATQSSSHFSAKHGSCYELYQDISASALNYDLKLFPPKDQDALTDFVVRYTSDNSNITKDLIQGTAENSGTYKIYTVLCVPKTQDAEKTAELAIHGINADHTYWHFGGEDSKYSYVEASLKAGHAIMMYDRLGVGKSDKPDGIKEVQMPTEVEIAVKLIQHLQSKPHGLSFNGYIGIGHSYGSAQLTALASKHGNLLNGTILTGYSTSATSASHSYATWTSTIAAESDPERFKGLPSTYTVSNNRMTVQQNFFTYPNYDPAVLDATTSGKQPATLGELLTILQPLPAGPTPYPQYSNPVLVVTGDKDYIFCAGDCYQQVDGVNIVAKTKEAFPNVPESSFSTYIPAGTGHAVNLHFSAPETYEEIQKWIASLY